MSPNEDAKRRAAQLLEEGAIFAFGLSEQEHGADVYSTDMLLTPNGDGSYLANGEKYYIGNGNEARMVSTFGKLVDTRRVRLLRRRLSAPELRADRERGQQPELRLELRPARLPGRRGRHPPPRRGCVQRRAQHRERRQVQPRLGLDRDLHARPLRSDQPRRQPPALRQRGDRLPAREAAAHRRLREDRGDEAVRPARLATTCAPRLGTTGATCSTTRS